MSKFKLGQQLWTFDFDAGAETWSIYQVTIVDCYRSACMLGEWITVKLPDGSLDETVKEDQLFENKDDAVKALLEFLETCRDNMHRSIIEHTKRIADAWNAIDFCTSLEERIKKQLENNNGETN